jgi:hypothetical protein
MVNLAEQSGPSASAGWFFFESELGKKLTTAQEEDEKSQTRKI